MKTSIYKQFVYLLNVVFLMISTSIISKGQVVETENFTGTYYSDTIVNTPQSVYIYTIYINRKGVTVKKIDIEQRDTTVIVSIPNTKLSKTFNYQIVKRKSEEIIYEAVLHSSQKLNEYDIINVKDGATILSVSFLNEFISVKSTNLRGISETSKLYRCVSYYENGKTKSIGGFKNGKKFGYWLLYSEIGEITSKNFNDGIELK